MEYKIVKSDELYHYGVLGMKWGIRKVRKSRDPRVAERARKKVIKYYDKKLEKSINKKVKKYNDISSKRKRNKKIENAVSKLTKKYKKKTIKSIEKIDKISQKYMNDLMEKSKDTKISEIKDYKNKTIFISGSSKTQEKNSPYYRKNLPTPIKKSIKKYINDKSKIVVGDAPGIDRQVQDYLAKKKYENVEIYGPGEKVRYAADKKWKTNPINSEYEIGSKKWLAEKDKAMEKVSTEGLAVVIPNGSSATRKNIDRLVKNNKEVKIYELNDFKLKDKWINR